MFDPNYHGTYSVVDHSHPRHMVEFSTEQEAQAYAESNERLYGIPARIFTFDVEQEPARTTASGISCLYAHDYKGISLYLDNKNHVHFGLPIHPVSAYASTLERAYQRIDRWEEANLLAPYRSTNHFRITMSMRGETVRGKVYGDYVTAKKAVYELREIADANDFPCDYDIEELSY